MDDREDHVRDLLEELFAKPVRRADRGDVLVFLHESQLAAESYAAANREFYGYDSTIEESDEGWLSLVDIGPAIRRAEEQLKNG